MSVILKVISKIWTFISSTFFIAVISAVVLLALAIIMPDNANSVIEMVKSLFV